jgi:alkylated DNA repair dioxygenase AlkB
MPKAEYISLKGEGTLTLIHEDDGSDSIFYYHPNFFRQDFSNIKKRLFEVKDWRGDKKTELSSASGWIPPRLQRWSQVSNFPFHKDWPIQYDRWQPAPYYDWLLEFQTNTNRALIPIFDEIAKHTKSLRIPNLNSVLLTLYRDGLDKIGLHRDHAPAFGTFPTVICASFGGTRVFNIVRVHPNTSGALKLNIEEAYLNHSFKLDDYSLMIMAGSTQIFNGHEIPADAIHNEPRISATFRDYNEITF